MSTDSHLALVPTLIADFPRFLTEFETRQPFAKSEQLESHRQTIQLRQRAGSVAASLADPEFVESLHRTLRAWGIGSRGSKLRALPDFSTALQKAAPQIATLDGLRIDAADLNVDYTIAELWRLIESLKIVDNAAPIVSGTKALHHVLPELVPPMDRAYTQTFFLWHNRNSSMASPIVSKRRLPPSSTLVGRSIRSNTLAVTRGTHRARKFWITRSLGASRRYWRRHGKPRRRNR
jgi:hypothetical protein